MIVPVYNMERTLRRCLDSVLSSAREDYELIAVNDGSTDASPAILAEYQARFPGLVRRIDLPNSGLGRARNMGLEAARGDYLFFLDSDDYLLPGAFSAMLTAAGEGGFDILIFDYLTVDEAGRALGYERGCRRTGSFSLTEHPALLSDPPNVWNKLFRRGLFWESGLRFPDRLWYEDLCTVPCLYPCAGVIRALPVSWYCYVRRNGSIMHTPDARRNREIIPAVDLLISRYREAGVYGAFAPQLEYAAVLHQLYDACVRVNRFDRESPVQDALLEDLSAKFPRWTENPYVRAMPARRRLLLSLIRRRRYGALHALLRLNDLLKR